MSGDRITVADVPESVGPRSAAAAPAAGGTDLSRYGEVPLRELRDLVERDYILKKLEEHDWNITQAAQALGVERTNLHKKIKQHGLSRAGRGAARPPRRTATRSSANWVPCAVGFRLEASGEAHTVAMHSLRPEVRGPRP